MTGTSEVPDGQHHVARGRLEVDVPAVKVDKRGGIGREHRRMIVYRSH